MYWKLVRRSLDKFQLPLVASTYQIYRRVAFCGPALFHTETRQQRWQACFDCKVTLHFGNGRRNDEATVLTNFLVTDSHQHEPKAATMCCTRLGCSTPTSCQWFTASRTRPKKTRNRPPPNQRQARRLPIPLNNQADSHTPGEEMERQLVATKREKLSSLAEARTTNHRPTQHSSSNDDGPEPDHNFLPLVTALEGTLNGETQRPACFRVSDNSFGVTALSIALCST